MGAVKEPVANLYDADFVGWADQQAHALRARRHDLLDYDNLIEEVESMGKQVKSELVNRLSVLLAHLLKWQFQPRGRGRSWRLTLEEQRRQIAILMEDSPSLRPYRGQAIDRAYGLAIIVASRESRLSKETFPPICPYSFEQACELDWLPE